MHMFSKEKHFYGGHGIVAAQVPIGRGPRFFADKYLGNDRVTLPISARRSPTRARWPKPTTWAELWDLPCILSSRTTSSAMGTSVKRARNPPISWGKRRRPYGHRGRGRRRHGRFWPSRPPDEKAVAHCRAGKGP